MTAFKALLCGCAFVIVAPGWAVAQSAGSHVVGGQVAVSQISMAGEAPAVAQEALPAAAPIAAPANVPINAMIYDVQPPASGAPLALRPPRGINKR